MKPRIFISAVSHEFKTARVQIEHTLELLGFEAVQQDIFGTESGDLREMLRRKIDSCEGLIQLVGHGYGASPPTDDEEFGRVSYTQYEFLYAQKQKKKTWLLYPGDDCYRDTSIDKLDLPYDPAHPDKKGYQTERRQWQQLYRNKVEAEGSHLRHACDNDDRLKLALHEMRNDFDKVREDYLERQKKQERLHARRLGLMTVLMVLMAGLIVGGLWWLKTSQKQTTEAIKQAEVITIARLRAQLQEASEKTLAKDLTDAEINKDWQERDKLKQAAKAAHEQRVSQIDAYATEFARLEGNEASTNEVKELIRIADEQGVEQALAYLDSKRTDILAQVEARKEREQRRQREMLQPLLSGINLAKTKGDLGKVQTLYQDLLKADANWQEIRYDFVNFLLYTSGPRAQTHESLTKAQAVYQEAERQAKLLTLTDPANNYWLRELSVSYNNIGEVAAEQGDLKEAARLYEEARKIREKLVLASPEKELWQRDLSVSYSNLGEIAVAQGDLKEAARLYQEHLKISEKLTTLNPTNKEWQRDLSVCYNTLGDLASAEGDLNGATRSYKEGLKIREKLALAEPKNHQWQRDLSLSYERLGELAMEQASLSEAARLYQAALNIREKLALADPGNTEGQRDLSVSYSQLGKVAIAQENLIEASRLYKADLKITEKLALADPGNKLWQRDLSVSFNKLGDVTAAQGVLSEASRLYQEGLKIREKLAASDITNSQWQRDVYVSHYKLAVLAEQQNDADAAARHWQAAYDKLKADVDSGMHVSPNDLKVLEIMKTKLAAP